MGRLREGRFREDGIVSAPRVQPATWRILVGSGFTSCGAEAAGGPFGSRKDTVMNRTSPDHSVSAGCVCIAPLSAHSMSVIPIR